MTCDPFQQFREQCQFEILGNRALSPAAKNVGVCLALHLNRKTRLAFPGIDTIANECGIHRRTVFKLIEQLRDAGHVEVITGRGKAKRDEYNSNHYNLLLGAETVAEGKLKVPVGAPLETPLNGRS